MIAGLPNDPIAVKFIETQVALTDTRSTHRLCHIAESGGTLPGSRTISGQRFKVAALQLQTLNLCGLIHAAQRGYIDVQDIALDPAMFEVPR